MEENGYTSNGAKIVLDVTTVTLRKRSTSAAAVCGCNFTVRFGGNLDWLRMISVRCSEFRGVRFSEVRKVLVLW